MMMFIGVFLLLPIVSYVFSQVGTHVVARGKTVETLVLTVLAMTGPLVGNLLLGEDFTLIFSFTIVVGYYYFFKKIRLAPSKREALFILLFVVFTSLNQWLLRYFPFLETHYSRALMGDIVTLSGKELYVSFAVFILLAVYLFVKRRFFFKDTINNVIFSKEESREFTVTYLMTIIMGSYAFGQLFVLGLLFIVPIVLGFRNKLGHNTYQWLAFSICGIGSLLGFYISLTLTRMSTVPTILIIIFMISLVSAFFSSRRTNC